MKEILPLVIVFLGAGASAYFSIIKSKKGRLWHERYELFRRIVNSVEMLREEYSVYEREIYGEKMMSPEERV